MLPANVNVGSWFPTGYYGHVRSKPRADYVCQYRQLAKPQPPRLFLSRSLVKEKSYPFSLHDNRGSFMSDAVYFEQGLGKRKIPERTPVFDPDFCTWMPLRKEISRSLPHLSTYQTTYNQGRTRQRLMDPPEVYPERNDTTYHYFYHEHCPHKKDIKDMARPALHLSTVSREKSARRNPPQPLESVASCLSWYRGPRKIRGMPAANNVDLTSLPHVPTPPSSGAPKQGSDSNNNVSWQDSTQPCLRSSQSEVLKSHVA